MKLKDRVAVITGGGSGIGRAVAILFAAQGAKIAILDINDDGANETVALIAEAGGKANAYVCNVSDSASVSEIIPTIVETYEGLDVVFNNAAFNRTIPPTPEDIFNVSIDHWNNVISTNLSGMLHLSKAALPYLLESDHGVIVNVSSALGLASTTNATAYSASKAGVIGLTKAMAMDLGPKGVRVNAICPGAVNTPRLTKGFDKDRLADFSQRFPLRRIGQPEDIANLALFLASDDASYITGAIIPVDGGQSAQLAF